MNIGKKNQLTTGRRVFTLVALVAAGLVAPAVSLLAQDAASFESTATPPQAGEYRFTLGGGYRTEADLKDRPGNFSEAALRVTAAGMFGLTDRLNVAPIFSYQFSHYDWNDLGFATSRPWEDVHILRGSALLIYALDDRWSVYGGPSGSIAAESDADWGDALSGGVLAGFTYRQSETLSVGAGLGIFSRLKESIGVLPIITANWQFADAWTLRAGFTEVAGNGALGADVLYDFRNNWKVGGGIAFEQKRFLLRNDQRILINGRNYADGVGQDKSVPIFAKAVWQPTENITLDLLAGIVVGGQARIEDSGGHNALDNDYKTSAVIGVRSIFRF